MTNGKLGPMVDKLQTRSYGGQKEEMGQCILCPTCTLSTLCDVCRRQRNKSCEEDKRGEDTSTYVSWWRKVSCPMVDVERCRICILCRMCILSGICIYVMELMDLLD